MDKQKALQLAKAYAEQHNWGCDVIWFAGIVDGYYFVWLKNTSLPRYTGPGCALSISPEGKILDIDSAMEIQKIAASAMRLNNGHEFFKNRRIK